MKGVIQRRAPGVALVDVSHEVSPQDVMAAAHLAAGAPLEALGVPIGDPVRVSLPGPHSSWRAVVGAVVCVDHFGKLVTNVPATLLPAGETYRMIVGRLTVTGLCTTYGDVRVGQPLALVGSQGANEVAVRPGSAAEMVGAVRGAIVRLQPA